ncbi:MAG: septal ring lytic transglycosylase RlpA family protein [Nitrospira sp.]|nr:MAG: septal ring lytic transglycosylase RlpA family protein [Nitrospira sp.]
MTSGLTRSKRQIMISRSGQNRRRLLWAVGLSLGMLASGCSWVPKGASQLDVGIEDRGVASWYGGSFHGKQAANGKLFDMEAMTAAHRTLPLGSVVRVVNLANGKHLRVQITDRGPYVNNRILDLSRGAATRLGMMEGGLSHVRIQLVGDNRPSALFSSDAMETASGALNLGLNQASTGVVHPLPSNWGKLDPGLAYPLRLPPSDIWIQQRTRRLTGMQSQDHTDHTEIETVLLS